MHYVFFFLFLLPKHINVIERVLSFSSLCPDLYTFAISESAPVGTTLGRIMADDGDVGLNAKMNYSLEDLEESSTFTIQTDPDTQEGIVILAQVLQYNTDICLCNHHHLSKLFKLYFSDIHDNFSQMLGMMFSETNSRHIYICTK